MQDLHGFIACLKRERIDTPEDLVANIKGDLSVEEVYVFTPKGDIKSLPTGSTVIDFAYAIHSAVGNKIWLVLR